MATRPYPLVRIGFQAYNQPTLNAFTKFARDTALDNLALTGTTHVRPMPTKVKRWTVLKSPHVNKTAREQFERRTYRQQIAVHSQLPVFDDTLSPEQLAKEKAREAEAAHVWVNYLRESCPPGVGLNVVSWQETTVSPIANLQLDAIPHAALPDATPSVASQSIPVVEEAFEEAQVTKEEPVEEKPKRRRAATKKTAANQEDTTEEPPEKPKRAPRKTTKKSETPSSS